MACVKSRGSLLSKALLNKASLSTVKSGMSIIREGCLIKLKKTLSCTQTKSSLCTRKVQCPSSWVQPGFCILNSTLLWDSRNGHSQAVPHWWFLPWSFGQCWVSWAESLVSICEALFKLARESMRSFSSFQEQSWVLGPGDFDQDQEIRN